MAKAVAFIASALCFLAIAGFAHCQQKFYVEGKVYCDTCRLQFVTRLSHNLSGATVRLDCRNRTTEVVTFTTEKQTDSTGFYSIPVEGDHEDEICEVSLVSSPESDCNGPSSEPARISLTQNSGIVSIVRYANPLGFTKKEALPECAQILQEMQLIP